VRNIDRLQDVMAILRAVGVSDGCGFRGETWGTVACVGPQSTRAARPES